MTTGFASALTGHRFEKIVVLLPHRDINAREKDWLESVLPLKLPPDGRVWYV